MYAPACCLALKALSSSSSSAAGFFLGFLLWMGFVPAAYSKLLLYKMFDTTDGLRVGRFTDLPFLKASWLNVWGIWFEGGSWSCDYCAGGVVGSSFGR